MARSSARALSPQEVQDIHEASLAVLEDVGILVHSAEAREVLCARGCRLDDTGGVVRFPTSVVEETIKQFAPTFTFFARDPAKDVTLPDDGPVFVTGSSCIDVVDRESGQDRPATRDDVAHAAALVDSLAGIDILSIPLMASDAPSGLGSVARFEAALRHCTKPIRGSLPGIGDLDGVLQLGEAFAGGSAAYAERPLITHHQCPMVSPLVMDSESTALVLEVTGRGLPCYCCIVPNGGLTSPATLAGTLVVGNVEVLAAAVLQHAVRPGVPIMYGSLPTMADIRTGDYAPGAAETGVLTMAQGQLAEFYALPYAASAGLTNAHENGAQAGYETGMNALAAALGGASLINMAGLLSALTALDYGKLVVDSDIAGVIRRIVQGVVCDEQHIARSIIAEVGHRGSYLGHRTTRSLSRQELFFPEVAERGNRESWKKTRRHEHSRAVQRASQSIADSRVAPLPGAVEELLSSTFPALLHNSHGAGLESAGEGARMSVDD